MSRCFEKMLVEQCAPTLSGIKPANLFRYCAGGGDAVRREIAYWDKELSQHGISVKIIKECPESEAVLVYVYRKRWVEKILADPETVAFLKQKGYMMPGSCGFILQQLSNRLCAEKHFPHEIGVFLGYPLEDVIGFIENRGRNYTCCGFWKTYGDPREARHRFDRYRNCIRMCMNRFENGIPVIQLLAAV